MVQLNQGALHHTRRNSPRAALSIKTRNIKKEKQKKNATVTDNQYGEENTQRQIGEAPYSQGCPAAAFPLSISPAQHANESSRGQWREQCFSSTSINTSQPSPKTGKTQHAIRKAARAQGSGKGKAKQQKKEKKREKVQQEGERDNKKSDAPLDQIRHCQFFKYIFCTSFPLCFHPLLLLLLASLSLCSN